MNHRIGRSTKLLHRLKTKLRGASGRKRLLRAGFVVSNVAVLAIVMVFVLQKPQESGTAQSLAAIDSDSNAQTAANPLDQLSSADIAQTVAQMNDLPEATAVANQAQSEAANIAMAATSNNVISKPQVVTTALKSKADIQTYTTVAGDTLSSLATKFGVTSDSIRWSNSLPTAGDNLTPGSHLVIPPVNGIVYTVKPGDTPASLAAQFNANQDQIIIYNDAEVGGLIPGQQIIIPNATQNRTGTAATIAVAAGLNGGFAFGNAPVYGYNGYDYGYCTWYVATQMPVPANWGNANTWAYYAPASGWRVSKTPVAGSIGQTSAGAFGHVAIVEAVSPDGTMIKYSDMNGLRGWGNVGTTPGWVPASKFQNYIYR